MKWLELIIKLSHYVAVAGSYAAVIEVILKVIKYLWLLIR